MSDYHLHPYASKKLAYICKQSAYEQFLCAHYLLRVLHTWGHQSRAIHMCGASVCLQAYQVCVSMHTHECNKMYMWACVMLHLSSTILMHNNFAFYAT